MVAEVIRHGHHRDAAWSQSAGRRAGHLPHPAVFNAIVRTRDVVTAIRSDTAFLDAVRRGILPLPSDHRPPPRHIFGPLRGAAPPPLPGRVGVVASGGSGALASLVGVAKAREDSGTEVSVYSVCSGSALFGFPLGTGMSPGEVAELAAVERLELVAAQ